MQEGFRKAAGKTAGAEKVTVNSSRGLGGSGFCVGNRLYAQFSRSSLYTVSNLDGKWVNLISTFEDISVSAW
jgi:hypothetical protein